MIHNIVQSALRQRFLILVLVTLLIVAGAYSFQRMPVDAYPDLSPPRVQFITQWPGSCRRGGGAADHAPLELAMNGTPSLHVMRSISLTACPLSSSPSMKAPTAISRASWPLRESATPRFPPA